jgi:hypothetical protein
MTSENEASELLEIIEQFYKFANVHPPRNLHINEHVAEVFGIMLNETAKCSKAIGWVPVPPGGRATISWLVVQLGRGVFNRQKSRLNPGCAHNVIRTWKTALDMASLGMAAKPGALPSWT